MAWLLEDDGAALAAVPSAEQAQSDAPKRYDVSEPARVGLAIRLPQLGHIFSIACPPSLLLEAGFKVSL